MTNLPSSVLRMMTRSGSLTSGWATQTPPSDGRPSQSPMSVAWNTSGTSTSRSTSRVERVLPSTAAPCSPAPGCSREKFPLSSHPASNATQSPTKRAGPRARDPPRVTCFMICLSPVLRADLSSSASSRTSLPCPLQREKRAARHCADFPAGGSGTARYFQNRARPATDVSLTAPARDRKGGRVVDCTGLENRRCASIRGFESHPFRHINTQLSDIYNIFTGRNFLPPSILPKFLSGILQRADACTHNRQAACPPPGYAILRMPQ